MPDGFDDEFLDDEEQEDEWDEERNAFFYLKYTFDGCGILAELTALLRAFADDLEHLGADGWELVQPVDSGHVHLAREAG